MLKFNDYNDCLFKNRIILKSQQWFKSESHCRYTEEINKIALNSNDDKKLQTFDRITTYPYRTNAFKVCESEMLSKYKWLILMVIQMKRKQSIIQNRPYISDHPYRILIIGGSGSRKTNVFLNLINGQILITYIYMKKINMNQNINF